jgi:hypothetical protein
MKTARKTPCNDHVFILAPGDGNHGYLLNSGLFEHAQQSAALESPRTTKLYDRNRDEVSLDESEKILIKDRVDFGISGWDSCFATEL